jgi:hypothetical protein
MEDSPDILVKHIFDDISFLISFKSINSILAFKIFGLNLEKGGF